MNSTHGEPKFTTIIAKDFVSKRIVPITIVLSIIFSIAILGFLFYDSGYLNTEITITGAALAFCIALLFALVVTFKETIDLQKQKKFFHNKNIEYVQKTTNDIISQSELGNTCKEISIFHKDAGLMDLKYITYQYIIIPKEKPDPRKKREIFYEDKFLVNAENSTLGYLNYEINEETGEEKYNLSIAKFNEVIDFELIDKTTSTQISLAKTSANSNDIIAGAAASEFLFNNSTTGAIMGASADITTKTVTQTLKDELYQINIQLDNMQNPIIKIEAKDREIVSQVIAMLKIIMNKSKVKES